MKTLEEIIDEKFDPLVWEAINQMRKVRFGTIKGKYAVTVFAKNAKSGIALKMDEQEQRDAGDTTIIQRIVITDGSVISFEYANNHKKREKVRKMIKGRSKILGLISIDDLNQIHTGLIDNIDDHLLKEDIIEPLLVKYEGLYVDAMTTTIFKHMKFEFKEGALVPGVRDINNFSYPSFIMTARARLLKMRTSIDQ